MSAHEDRQQGQGQPPQPRAEDWKGPKARRSKGEVLGYDVIAQRLEMGTYQLPGSCCLGSAGFTGDGENLAGSFV
jgi:hypothetical protein